MNKYNKKLGSKNKGYAVKCANQKLKRDYQIENNLYWSLFVNTEEDLKRREALKELNEKLIKIDSVSNH